MTKLTEHLRLPAGDDYRPPPKPDDFDDVGPLTPNTRAQRLSAASFVLSRLGYSADGQHASEASHEVLQALFDDRGPRGNRKKARRTHRRAVADPSRSQHPPENISSWRAQVCAWGRENGWPDAHSRHALDPGMLAAYRAAHPQDAS